MKHDIPAPTGAIDWASESHVGAVVDHDGELVARYDFSHTAEGLAAMLRRFASHGVEAVAIERGDGPVVETLLDAAFEVFVISSRQLKNLRGRYGSAGNKDDALDAFVLADVLRTDRRRLRPLERDGDRTRAVRALTRARKDLIAARVALGNQLLANLQIALPGVIGLFHRLDSPISLAFLRRFTTADKTAWLSAKRLDAWLSRQGYAGGKTGTALHATFLAAPAGIRGPEAAAREVGPWRWSLRSNSRTSRSPASNVAYEPTSKPIPTHTSSRRCPRAGPSEQRRCSPRSATPAAGFPPTTPSRRSPEQRPRPAAPASCTASPSASPATRNCVTLSSTSPTTPGTPHPGPPTSTSAPETAGTVTPMP